MNRSELEEAIKFLEAMADDGHPVAGQTTSHWMIDNPVATEEAVALRGVANNLVMKPGKLASFLKGVLGAGLQGIELDPRSAEHCAAIAEGPPYKTRYRGHEGHNWSADGSSDYGRGRIDAAMAIRQAVAVHEVKDR